MNRPLPDIRTLPQWAKTYICKLRLNIATLTNELNRAQRLVESYSMDAHDKDARIERLETTIKTLKEIGYED